ncbi:hypothetical protein [Seonamhaeicola marinus]|uniref:Class I SAM-dependent methyltransferase n=1 Tax=Seonamhaeicola marinus TaxID=1912246 RepID=A0A5D0I6A2_9FLAO|nr:hypothetical protein [Seonamhaeicola marinus]TYA78439.1 hypothetical protein FUA24_08765 [Seonamhaeicola marinus]
MKRKELFEFEDFNWFPESIRTGLTNLILVFHKMMGTTEVLATLIGNLRAQLKFDTIVDMGSGSGGPMPNVVKAMNENSSDTILNLLLTDLHPNKALVEKINNDTIDYISYREKPLNALDFSEIPSGLKTMIASFHHMSPRNAKQILKTASDNKQPIFIFELAKNNVPFVAWLLLLPLSLSILIIMSLVMTPFSKNLTFTQLLFTYIIPIIPIAYAWDGQASLMRTYSFNDINTLLADIREPNFTWEINEAVKPNGKKMGYYILGYPES